MSFNFYVAFARRVHYRKQFKSDCNLEFQHSPIGHRM